VPVTPLRAAIVAVAAVVAFAAAFALRPGSDDAAGPGIEKLSLPAPAVGVSVLGRPPAIPALGRAPQPAAPSPAASTPSPTPAAPAPSGGGGGGGGGGGTGGIIQG
jgi:hypothetical protein